MNFSLINNSSCFLSLKKTFSLWIFFVPLIMSANDLIKNGSFEKGLSEWTATVDSIAKAEIARNTIYAITGRGSMSIDVKALGTNPWDIQVAQPFDSKKNHYYTLSFWAKTASLDRQLRIQLQNNDSYVLHDVFINHQWKAYEIHFIAKSNNLQLAFQFLELGVFYIDDVIIKKTRKREAGLIENGDFENGLSGWVNSTSEDSAAIFKIEEDTNNHLNHFMKVYVSKLGKNHFDIITIQDLKTSKKKNYTISFDAKTENDDKTINLQLQKNELGIYITKTLKLSNKWQHYEEEFTLPVANMELVIQYINNGIFYFDNFQVHPEKIQKRGGYQKK